jgi:hypothetical protein
MTQGHDQRGLTPETWRYDLTALSWTQLMTSGTPGALVRFGYDVDQSCGNLMLAFENQDDGIDVASTDLPNLSSSPQFSGLPAVAILRHAPLILRGAPKCITRVIESLTLPSVMSENFALQAVLGLLAHEVWETRFPST